MAFESSNEQNGLENIAKVSFSSEIFNLLFNFNNICQKFNSTSLILKIGKAGTNCL